jgi:hypothetical protein
MLEDKEKKSWLLCTVLAFFICFACCEAAAAKAFEHEIPVKDPDIDVDIYNPDRRWRGTTLLANNHKPERPRIIEINMQGQVKEVRKKTCHLRKTFLKRRMNITWHRLEE